MRTAIAIFSAALIAADHLDAQDLAMFATTGRHESWRPLIYGAGVSLSGFTRLGSVMGRDAGSLQRSGAQVGIRLTYTELRYAERSRHYCPDEACSPLPASRVETRLQTYQVALLVLPYRTRWTRVELGGGVALSSRAFAFSGTLGGSWRLSRQLPLWAAIAWEPQKWFQEAVADGPSVRLPRQSFRLGLSYAVRGR